MLTPLAVIEWGLLTYIAAAVAALLTFRIPRLWNYLTHGICAAASAVILASSIWCLVIKGTYMESVGILTTPLPKSVLYLDPLSAFITAVISLVSLYTSVFAIGYVDEYFTHKGKLINLGVNYPIFLASMTLVALAGDAVLFIIAWEIMSVTSFFLVLTEHERTDVRRAAFIYIVYASISIVFISIAFGVGYYYTHTFTFIDWGRLKIPSIAASAMFALFLIGFSAKAGIVPLHSWLPQAHPAAPSHVSALLSGVMVKLAIYGLVRMFIYVLAPWVGSWWSAVLLALGSLTSFYGIAYALIQSDVKRLLAYSTIENMGIILLGIGASLAGLSANVKPLALLGLMAALIHTLNHAIYKSNLFLCSGSILRHSRTRNLERMGGLARRLKATAIAFLVGSLGISAIPFFNGFFSEWLTYNALLQGFSSALVSDFLRFLSLIGFATLSAAGVLTIYCFTKAYGAAFLGEARWEGIKGGWREPLSIKLSYVLPSILIVGLGLLPGLYATPLTAVISKCIASLTTPLLKPGLGVEVVLWSKPSLYVPIVIGSFTAAIGFTAWASTLSKVRVRRVTHPFISGVKFGRELIPTPTMYSGNALDTLSNIYGVRKRYVRDYLVKYWTTSRVRVESMPLELSVKLLRRLGLSDEDIRRAVGSADDVLQVIIHLGGRRLIEGMARGVGRVDRGINSAFKAVAKAVMAASRGVDHMDEYLIGGMRGIARGFSAFSRGVRKVQLGSIYVYLVYVYIALILILIYYVVVK